MTSATFKLITEKFQQFRKAHFEDHRLYDSLVNDGQNPHTLVIACSDSRVDPAILFDATPGELFMVRNVANLVPPYQVDPRHHGTSAALEFAVKQLKVEDIIILGHSNCGGIKALMSDEDNDSDFIDSWMHIAERAKKQVINSSPNASSIEQVHACELASILVSLENLKTFPWIKERVEDGTLSLHAWYFDMASGNILAHGEDGFKALTA